jgi:NAD(P)-dependent dehydrogenase (short-subunit alcohol dehydrogenase family)
MPQRLAGRVALISGAARGIGAAVARLFVEEGARVVLGDILEGKAEDLAAELNRSAPRGDVSEQRNRDGKMDSARAVHLDVTNHDDWDAAVAAAVREFGVLNILVNNAGITSLSGVEDTTEEMWQRVVDINQKGVWLGMKAAVPSLRDAGGGAIVNLSSIYGLTGSGDSLAYHGSKAAVRLLSKAAAVQYAPENIRVNTVLPGFTRTPMIDALPREVIDPVLPSVPLKRLASPREIAYGVLFLASQEASFITGAELVIDGGLTASAGS